MSNDKVETVEIVEALPVQEETKIDISELPEQEQKMAQDLGLVPKETDEEKKEKEVKDQKEELKTFEEVEKDEKTHLKSYNKNEQALYFKWKEDKRARQDAQAERDLNILQTKTLKKELEKAQETGNLTVTKLNAVEKLLAGPADEITIEALQAILKAEVKKVEDNKDDKPLTKADLKQMQEEEKAKSLEQAENNRQFATRMQTLETYGKENYDNYDDIIAAAKDVLDGKVDLGVIDKADIARRFVEKVNDKKNSEQDVAEFVLGMAKLNPNFGKKKEENKDPKKVEKKVSSEDIDKIVKNAAKSQTSVNTGGNSRRVVNVNDISLEDASKLTVEQYKALPKDVRNRLLQE